ncbi:hypothetical protein Glove_541g82 [Diversispora epigaea]|uniref:Uncharacterized protein n=1 Tax=Diversispora epigaea TaxID=1348612 RepID=A0A397GHD6_9GLOM|nr:hypothetical protein Glove_541g82 [Diversispora epigaea]
MFQESRTSRIYIKRRVELSSLQNEPSSTHNEPESSETSKKSEQTSTPQTVHFSEELESTIPETVDELKIACIVWATYRPLRTDLNGYICAVYPGASWFFSWG